MFGPSGIADVADDCSLDLLFDFESDSNIGVEDGTQAPATSTTTDISTGISKDSFLSYSVMVALYGLIDK